MSKREFLLTWAVSFILFSLDGIFNEKQAAVGAIIGSLITSLITTLLVKFIYFCYHKIKRT